MARTNPEMLAAFLALINTQMERKRDRSIAEEGRAFELAMNKMTTETQAKISERKSIVDQMLREQSVLKTKVDEKFEEASGIVKLMEGLSSTGATDVAAKGVDKARTLITSLQKRRQDVEKNMFDVQGNVFELQSQMTDIRDMMSDYTAGKDDAFSARYAIDIMYELDPSADWITKGEMGEADWTRMKTFLANKAQDPGETTAKILYAKIMTNSKYELGLKGNVTAQAKSDLELRKDIIQRQTPTESFVTYRTPEGGQITETHYRARLLKKGMEGDPPFSNLNEDERAVIGFQAGETDMLNMMRGVNIFKEAAQKPDTGQLDKKSPFYQDYLDSAHKVRDMFFKETARKDDITQTIEFQQRVARLIKEQKLTKEDAIAKLLEKVKK